MESLEEFLISEQVPLVKLELVSELELVVAVNLNSGCEDLGWF